MRRKGASLHALACIVAGAFAALSAAPAEAGQILQFQGANRQAAGGPTPPDMGGAVGDGYVLQMLNGAVSTYSTAGKQVGPTISLNTFWTTAGLTSTDIGTAVSDPRVIYDPASKRWFASSVSTQYNDNNILVAVSKTSDPTQGFSAFTIPAGVNSFADFPTLAVNNAAVTIGTNNYPDKYGGTSLGQSLYSIPKTSLVASTPSLGGMTSLVNTSALYGSPQAATDASPTGTTTTILSTASLVTNQGANLSEVAVSTLSQTPSGPTLSKPGFYANTVISPPTQATQPGSFTYDSGDSRISSGVTQVGSNVYFANTGSNGVNDFIQWGVLITDPNASLDRMVTSTISTPGLDLTYPSVSANADGTFVIAFNGSGKSTNISDYYVLCSSVTFVCGQPVQDYTSKGVSNYYQTNSGTVNRWGDYSWTAADPNNPANFWLFQEYAASASNWGTVITEISTPVPEPGALSVFGLALATLAAMRRQRPRQTA